MLRNVSWVSLRIFSLEIIVIHCCKQCVAFKFQVWALFMCGSFSLEFIVIANVSATKRCFSVFLPSGRTKEVNNWITKDERWKHGIWQFYRRKNVLRFSSRRTCHLRCGEFKWRLVGERWLVRPLPGSRPQNEEKDRMARREHGLATRSSPTKVRGPINTWGYSISGVEKVLFKKSPSYQKKSSWFLRGNPTS